MHASCKSFCGGLFIRSEKHRSENTSIWYSNSYNYLLKLSIFITRQGYTAYYFTSLEKKTLNIQGFFFCIISIIFTTNCEGRNRVKNVCLDIMARSQRKLNNFGIKVREAKHLRSQSESKDHAKMVAYD